MITLESERLIIRDYKESDLTEYHEMMSNKENMYYLYDIITNSIEESSESLMNTINVCSKGMAHRFGITEKGNDKLIGSVGYEIRVITPVGKVADPMGWFMMPEYQNKGYMTEAVKRVLEFAFFEDNCIRVATGCFKDNIPTQKVMKKAGFRKEADKPQAMWLDGQMRDRLEFAINRDEHLKKI